MIPQNCNTTLNRQMVEEALEDIEEKSRVDPAGFLPPPPPIKGVIAKVKAFNAFLDELERLGYPQYNAICSFNGWKIQQIKGKRTP